MPDRMKGFPPFKASDVGQPADRAPQPVGVAAVREIVPSADYSVTRFGSFNLFAQQLQSQPLVLGCR